MVDQLEPRTSAGRKLLRLITSLGHRIHDAMPEVDHLDYDATAKLIRAVEAEAGAPEDSDAV